MPDWRRSSSVATTCETVNEPEPLERISRQKIADGSPNTVYSCMGGEIYTGVAFVVDAWYVTKYHPIVDDSGKRLLSFLSV
jgi:hypothetical protein